MAGFARTVSIQKPIEEVFDFATDLANAPLFLPGICVYLWLMLARLRSRIP